MRGFGLVEETKEERGTNVQARRETETSLFMSVHVR
jgi:hypothetical protein